MSTDHKLKPKQKIPPKPVAHKWVPTGLIVGGGLVGPSQRDFICTGCGERRGFDDGLDREVMRELLKTTKCKAKA